MTKMLHDDVAKIFEPLQIDLVADGIGNCDIHYVWDDGYTTQKITLGGYCDMAPFKWTVSTKWKVGGTTRYDGNPWEVHMVDEKEVECCGEEYDTKKEDYFWDKEYVDLIIEARNALVALLPEFKKKTDVIHENELAGEYSLCVTNVTPSRKFCPTAGDNRWQGIIQFHGKLHSTETFDDFLKAKKATDDLLEQCIKEREGK